MAASDVDTRKRLHHLVDELTGAQLDQAEAVLTRLRQARTTTSRPTRRPTLHLAFGLLKTDTPPPTDDEVKRWLEEERLKKFR